MKITAKMRNRPTIWASKVTSLLIIHYPDYRTEKMHVASSESWKPTAQVWDLDTLNIFFQLIEIL